MKSKMKIETGKAVVAVDWGRICESCHVIEMELKGVALTLLPVPSFLCEAQKGCQQVDVERLYYSRQREAILGITPRAFYVNADRGRKLRSKIAFRASITASADD